jgi:hypothetical protein
MTSMEHAHVEEGVFRRYHVGGNPLNGVDPLGLLRFQALGQTISVEFSGTFLPVNISWDPRSNKISYNANFPPLSLGIGVDISINPPSPCEKYVQPYIELGKNLSLGTNLVSTDRDPFVRRQGLNISLGLSVGLPGMIAPNGLANNNSR